MKSNMIENSLLITHCCFFSFFWYVFNSSVKKLKFFRVLVKSEMYLKGTFLSYLFFTK
jgi:hypothetical protein